MTKKHENQSNFQESRPKMREKEISWHKAIPVSGKDGLETQRVFINYYKSSKICNLKTNIKINGQKILR